MTPLRIAPAALALVALAPLASCSRRNTAGLALSLALEQAYPGDLTGWTVAGIGIGAGLTNTGVSIAGIGIGARTYHGVAIRRLRRLASLSNV